MANLNGLIVLGAAILMIYFALAIVGSAKGATRLLDDYFVGYQIARTVLAFIIVAFALAFATSAVLSLLR